MILFHSEFTHCLFKIMKLTSVFFGIISPVNSFGNLCLNDSVIKFFVLLVPV